MSFVWRNFLELAKGLPKNNETEQRTAISRAYYAVFCTARDLLINSNISVPPNVDSHTRVRDLYDLSGDFESQRISQTLDRLRLSRNSADYDTTYNGNLEKAALRDISRSEKALQMIDGFPEKIIDEIRQNS